MFHSGKVQGRCLWTMLVLQTLGRRGRQQCKRRWHVMQTSFRRASTGGLKSIPLTQLKMRLSGDLLALLLGSFVYDLHITRITNTGAE